ncbi:hypothetical protein [Streptomyces sp. CB02009]|uniref:hypothetical protein n=1 Tax=Streptomyces sp. CB02009 TaxID=1703938 RepID=UPI000B09EE57|nr:hypothetical protein [Streptomyces sp. CB02009]
MNNPLTPHPTRGSRVLVLLLVLTAGVAAAQSQEWASALGTAAAVYTAMSTGDPNRRS